MSRCDNNVLISKVGMKPLNKTIEVDFAVLTDLENCVRINTRNYVETQGSPVFSPSSIPNDMFGCLSDDCENSGTLNLTGTGSVNATFISRSDATLFSVGVITYYVFFRNAGTYTVRTAITDITDTNFNNRDEYFTNDIEVFRPGFHPVVVDLSEAPLVTDENTDSNGWTPMRRGIRLRITVSNSSGSGSINAGISSIFIYNSIEDFEVNDVVKVGCIDEFSGEFTLDARDASCFGVGYDPASISIERTITGRSVTANYWKLNPLTKRYTGETEKNKAWLPRTIEEEIQGTIEFNGITYGVIELPDLQSNECAFLLASLAHNCATEGILNRIHTPVAVEISETQFILLDGTLNERHYGMLLFHENLIGTSVNISYPQEVDAEHFVGNAENLDARRVRMSIVKEQTDGVKQHYIYNNVLVTSFPDSLSDEETTFDFTISVQRDREGNFYNMFRVAN